MMMPLRRAFGHAVREFPDLIEKRGARERNQADRPDSPSRRRDGELGRTENQRVVANGLRFGVARLRPPSDEPRRRLAYEGA